MTPRPISEIEADLLDCLLAQPQIEDSYNPDDYYRESECHSILADRSDEKFQARSQAFLTHLHSCWTDVDPPPQSYD